MHPARELNLDGLPGPTHHFAGLAHGNLASMRHRFESSSPRRAALQGLDKMRFLHRLGIPQAVCPPHERPHLEVLRQLGFEGDDNRVLQRAHRDAPDFFLAAFSSSAMWAANAATVSAAPDTSDRLVHLTPANLASQFHRSLEVPFTAALLQRLFPSPDAFIHHPPLPACTALRDEGAANHLRLCREHGAPGIEVFVWGEASSDPATSRTFPPRQTREASEAVAQRHRLATEATVFLRQNPAAIDAGVFHNDVISVANESVLLCHENAFAEGKAALAELRQRFQRHCGSRLHLVEITAAELSLADAVSTYLFNSQLVTGPNGNMVLIAPEECRGHRGARRCIERVLADENPVTSVEFVTLDQSMRNGGGPACLRLRVVLDERSLAATHPGVRYDEALDGRLRRWVECHYRDELHIDDLRDPSLLDQSRAALDELSGILDLGSIYPFQQAGG